MAGPQSPDRQTVPPALKDNKQFSAPPAGQGMNRYRSRTISWRACGKFECAKVLVPLDWDDPDGPAITLALKRKPASSSKATLFVNPGGPGGSGQEMMDSFKSSAFPNHDVIGWDPRGTGQSTHVDCGPAKTMDALFNLDASPDDEVEWQALVRGTQDFARSCRTHSGALLDHISTIDTARDLDYLRHLVGDKKLDYLGISYGTFLGATYAELYPGRVGRMVLDSTVNITNHDTVSQIVGFDRAFGDFASWCAKQEGRCALGKTEAEVRKATLDFLDRLDSHPIKVENRTLTQSLAATGIAFFLYSGKEAYPLLGGSLQSAMKDGNGSYLLAASDFLNGRGNNGQWERIASAFPAISCLDQADFGLNYLRKEWPKEAAKGPTLGKALGMTPTCEVWTAHPADQLYLTAQGAAPILVLGATGDPATPYEQAEWMADQLASGVLLTWRGAGHSAWELGNQCVKKAVEGYVNNGKVPKDKTVC
ncbi:alpha/beta hydrolase [Cutibacterium equinum]|uniref:Alpha/beta hydrolase n=1 Tax=Cutibacterium equinum TaxID=3016342 RepID=A0ABY7R0Z7_9ACTN|nr:alpha/beta hydrolase [Cutibacterium equinum]WCC80966.1 alpha/beta hydrolase [Cutibacterium equinum]